MEEQEEKPERRFPIRKLVATALFVPGVIAVWSIVSQLIDPIPMRHLRGKIEADLTQVLLCAEAFFRSTGQFPRSIAEMLAGPDSEGGVRPVCVYGPVDPFGNQYRYEIADGTPKVTFLGPDGQGGTGDEVIKTLKDLGPLQRLRNC